MTQFSEREMDVPILRILKNNLNGITTTQLIEALESTMHPDGHDVDILENRNDTYFSQKVRNHVCHRESKTSLVFRGLITYDPETHMHKITEEGVKYLNERERI